MELICSRELALRLGAVKPDDIGHHRKLKAEGHLLIRDEQGGALFWPWVSLTTFAVAITKRSS